ATVRLQIVASDRRVLRPAFTTTLVGHVVEQRRGSALLCLHALTALGSLTRFLTVLATHRERQRAQTRFSDFLTALEAITVGAFLEATQRRVDLGECLRLHLNERELDVFLNVDLGALALIQHVAFFAALSPDVANLSLDRIQQFAAALFEHLLELVIAARLCRHLRLRRRRHDACRSLPRRLSCSRRFLYDSGGYAIGVPASR